MVDENVIARQLDSTLSDFEPGDEFGERYHGKVRDTFASGDHLILITSDRISAFDHVLRQTIPFKGQVLNQLAAYFFEATADVVPNHVISIPDPNVTVAVRCDTVPVEFVVRAYLVGHAWRTYRSGKRELCGIPLPDGMKENQPFEASILTPTTKAQQGHDEDISRQEIIDAGILDESTFDALAKMAFSLFETGTRMAEERGLLLVDTKYEFGKTPDGRYVVIDEVHTPDSSRYFYADGFEDRLRADEPQRQLSKEFVREWLMDNGFMGKEGEDLPDLPDSFRIRVAQRYIELYETITGRDFKPDTHPNPAARIKEALEGALA
ncbi:MAG: phosphoribosylaminoimidazolesuccinocarboxamide synthase [Rhodothermia bacterium]|nr:phosphoribosylaminoimidazolesuccinocarboxamide synthase [Rhodothermia bacterium]